MCVCGWGGGGRGVYMIGVRASEEREGAQSCDRCEVRTDDV